MTKRERIYNKFNGLCAYSGTPLESDWQIDHIIPKNNWRWQQGESTLLKYDNIDYKKNDEKNLIPCQKIINHYKRGFDLNQFREYLIGLHTRIKKQPKNPKVLRSIKRKEYLFKVAGYFGVTENKPFDGKFYFEKI